MEKPVVRHLSSTPFPKSTALEGLKSDLDHYELRSKQIQKEQELEILMRINGKLIKKMMLIDPEGSMILSYLPTPRTESFTSDDSDATSVGLEQDEIDRFWRDDWESSDEPISSSSEATPSSIFTTPCSSITTDSRPLRPRPSTHIGCTSFDVVQARLQRLAPLSNKYLKFLIIDLKARIEARNQQLKGQLQERENLKHEQERLVRRFAFGASSNSKP